MVTQASETLDTPALRGFGGGSGSPASPLRTDWRDSLIDPEKIQILRRRDGRPWVLGGGAFGQVYKALYDGVQVRPRGPRRFSPPLLLLPPLPPLPLITIHANAACPRPPRPL